MILSEAYKWISLGIAVVPILLHSKRPAIPWKRYQSELPGPVDLIRWFRDGSHNLAVVCGWQNLTVLDFDTLTAYDKFASEHSDLLDTYSVLTNRGKHLYYFCDNPPKQKGLEGIDVKSSGYVLAPPSIHPSGKRYEIERGGEIMRVSKLIRCADQEPSMGGCQHRVSIQNNYGTVYVGLDTTNTRGHSATALCIKQQYPITAIFPHFQLTGNGMAIAHCPGKAHKNGDKNPSLSLDLRTNRANCFKPGCEFRSEYGNSNIDCWMIINNVDFKEAISQMEAEF